MEDLAGVPGTVVGGDGADARPGADHRTAGERDDVLAGGGAAAGEALGDQDAVALAETEYAFVTRVMRPSRDGSRRSAARSSGASRPVAPVARNSLTPVPGLPGPRSVRTSHTPSLTR